MTTCICIMHLHVDCTNCACHNAIGTSDGLMVILLPHKLSTNECMTACSEHQRQAAGRRSQVPLWAGWSEVDQDAGLHRRTRHELHKLLVRGPETPLQRRPHWLRYCCP